MSKKLEKNFEKARRKILREEYEQTMLELKKQLAVSSLKVGLNSEN